MDVDNKVRNQTRAAMMGWLSSLVSGPIILAAIYFSGLGSGSELPAEYEFYLLAGGIVAGLASLIMYSRFKAAVHAPAA